MASKEVKNHLTLIYREGLSRSPKWIGLAFRAYLLLPNHIVLRTPFLYFILGSDISLFKMDKGTTNYGLSGEVGQKCGNCVKLYKNVVENKNICSMVRGNIEEGAWCHLWEGDKPSLLKNNQPNNN